MMNYERTYEMKYSKETGIKIKVTIKQEDWTPEGEVGGLEYELEKKINEYGLPCTLTIAGMKTGGFFSSSIIPCLAITNDQRLSDYFTLIATVHRQGTFAFIEIYEYGRSKQLQKKHIEDQKLRAGKLVIMNRHDPHELRLEEEYYGLIVQAMYEIYNVR